MTSLSGFIVARLREPSTYASIAALIGILHLNIDPGAIQAMALWGGVAAAVMGAILTEGTPGRPVAQVVSDAGSAFVDAVQHLPRRGQTPGP